MPRSPRDSSPRKSMDEGSSRGEPRRRPRKDKGSRGGNCAKNMPFMEPDPLCDVTVIMNEKRLYTNMCLLAFNSPVLKQHFAESGGGKGAKGKSVSSNNDLDLSESKHSYNAVVDLFCILDPRADRPYSDESDMRVLPLVDEYEMKRVRRDCELRLTKSYRKMRKGKRAGMLPTDVTLEYLGCAAKYDFDDLLKMAIDDCVANDNPFGNKVICDSSDLSEKVKVQVLNKKLDRASMLLARERRLRDDDDDKGGLRKSGKSWKV